MDKNSLLHQFKTLDHDVMRLVIQDLNFDSCKHIPTPTQMQIVAYILEHQEEEIYQRDLENVLHLRRATVSGVLKTMEKNHFISRVKVSDDARVKKIVLESEVKVLFSKHLEKMKDLENILLEGTSEKERKLFSDVLKKMQNNLNRKMEELKC